MYFSSVVIMYRPKVPTKGSEYAERECRSVCGVVCRYFPVQVLRLVLGIAELNGVKVEKLMLRLRVSDSGAKGGRCCGLVSSMT